MRQRLGRITLALVLVATALASGAVAAPPDPPLQNVIGLQPGYWEMRMVGTTHTPQFNVPINRISHVCLKSGDAQKKLFIPKAAGRCKTSEDTGSDGTMHWQWTCTIVNGTTQGSGTVKTAADHFTSAWQVVSTLNLSNGYSTTTNMTLTGKRVDNRCPTGQP